MLCAPAVCPSKTTIGDLVRILIVEDEARVVQFLKRGFEEESFVVDVALDGEQGSRLGLAGEYDIIVLDVMLPRRTGIQVLRELRAAGILTPILILSAKGEVEDRVLGLDAGADDYLAKPFSFSEVLARVRSLLRRQTYGSDTPTTLAIADLRIDLLGRVVSRGGRDIPLTTKEFQVLEYLLRNKGRVLSRVILTERIWNMNFDSETNIVDVVINRLRRKLEDGFSIKLIHTVRGVGYAIREPEDEDPSAG